MAAFIRKLEDAAGNDQYPVTKAAAVYMEDGDNLEDKVTLLETTTGGITFGIEDGEYGYYKPGEGDEPEFVGFKSQADVDAAAQSGYDSGYAAAEADIKVSHKLTLTSGQIGSNVDIIDGWYTDLDASAVYQAGNASVAVVVHDFGNDWWNPSDTSGTTWDYKTMNISSDYPGYSQITSANLTAYIAEFSGTGGNDIRVKVNSYNASTGAVSIGCNGNLNHLHVALLIRP